MEHLFRFLLRRPAGDVAPEKVLSLDEDTAFQRALNSARESKDAATLMRSKAAKFVTSASYIDDVERLRYGAGFKALERRFASEDVLRELDAALLEGLVRETLGKTAAELVADPDFRSDRLNLADSIIATMLLRSQHSRPVTRLMRARRMMAMVGDVAGAAAWLDEPGGILAAYKRPARRPIAMMLAPQAGFVVMEGLDVPAGHGSIQPAGVADLLLVKQHLKRYQTSDVAHIENILIGEAKLREHRRHTTSETTVSFERETQKEEERDLETTERFELQQEVAETIKQNEKLEAGLTVSGSYGPTIEFEANAKGSIEKSRERATKHSSQYANEVTNKAASKVSERIREQRTLRLVEEIDEFNRHQLDNSGGRGHVIGVYQWVDKVYEAQVFNYGERAMYELMVPEPAAFLIATLQTDLAAASGLAPPADFTLLPSGVTEDNYGTYVLEYEASGVQPPPAATVTVAKVFSGGPEGDDSPTRSQFVGTAEISVPSGWRATNAYVQYSASLADVENWRLSVAVGQHHHVYNPADSNAGWSSALDDEEGQIPAAVRASHLHAYFLTIELTCVRTDRALKEWRQDTYAFILQAYQQKRRAYEEKLEALKAHGGIEISGQNPAANRARERDEIKKSCISLLTHQHFDLFDAIEEVRVNSIEVPQVRLGTAEVEGDYIRFFEQAFEWQNLTYVFYPYFWGRKSKWAARVNYTDTDPLFEAFLKAGAARVVVPVRPGFETALDHYMSTGETWNGGELPAIGSDDYVPILVEISEQLGAPGNEVAQGEPWEVVIPTSLVRLRADGSLPSWHKDADGGWQPDA